MKLIIPEAELGVQAARTVATAAEKLIASAIDAESLNKLSRFVGPSTAPQLTELAAQGFKPESLARRIDAQPEFAPLLQRSIEAGTTPRSLNSYDRWDQALYVSQGLGLNSPEMDRFLELELTDHGIFYDVSQSLREGDAGSNQIRKLVASGASAKDFAYQRVQGIIAIEQNFGSQPDTLNAIMSLEANGLDLGKLGSLVKAAPDKMRELVAAQIRNGVDADTLNYYSAKEYGPKAFKNLAIALAPDTNAVSLAAKMSRNNSIKPGLVHDFIAGNPQTRLFLVQSELGSPHVSPAKLDSEFRLPGAELAEIHLGDSRATLKAAHDFETAGRLNLWHLGTYVDENPTARVPLVRAALERQSPDTVRNLIALSAFPESTADKLAPATARGEVSLSQILAGVRDLNIGPRFTALVTNQTEQGLPLTRESIDALKHIAADRDIPVSAFKTTGETRETSRVLPISKRTVKEMADEAMLVTEILKERFDPDRTLVLLGRDMNPLVPMLRAQGRDARLFHWSRLQYGNESTVKQWLREVPRDSVVIDAGLSGSILTDIRKIDSSIDPFLLESATAYPQLMPRGLNFAEDLEILPKLTGRCRGYSPSGAALCQLRNAEDPQDFVKSSMSAVPYHAELLRRVGLPDWYVWRYKTFTGVSPVERIGPSVSE